MTITVESSKGDPIGLTASTAAEVANRMSTRVEFKHWGTACHVFPGDDTEAVVMRWRIEQDTMQRHRGAVT